MVVNNLSRLYGTCSGTCSALAVEEALRHDSSGLGFKVCIYIHAYIHTYIYTYIYICNTYAGMFSIAQTSVATDPKPQPPGPSAD